MCRESARGLDKDLEIFERFVGRPVACLPDYTKHSDFTCFSFSII